MGDRFDGSLAGGGKAFDPDISVTTALHDLTLNETLVTSDESGNLVLFRAIQNPKNGGLMYAAQPAEKNSRPLRQAIKLSQMSSMLSDHSRCSKYAQAISQIVSQTPECYVLDIGTGTGLLAMLAARAGANHVDAVEMFKPLANLASQVIRSNDFQHRISVHAEKSVHLSVNPSDENALQQRANVLVTEIFDSALLGEACIPVIEHARQHLLTPNATVVPAKATLFARVVTSKFLARFHDLGDAFRLHRSKTSRACKGGITGIPIHIDQLAQGEDYDFITDTFEAFDFDFMREDIANQSNRQCVKVLPRVKNGAANAVITWWVLDFFGDGSLTYSTEAGIENWQDHWLQMAYPLPYNGEDTGSSEQISIAISHDESSFNFALGTRAEREACSCGYHALAGSPYRIFDLGNSTRMEALSSRISSALGKALHMGTEVRTKLRCLDVSDSGVCAALATMNAPNFDVEVSSTDESDELSAFLYSQVGQRVQTARSRLMAEFEPLSALVSRETEAHTEMKDWRSFDVFLSEPYTRTMDKYPVSTLSNMVVQIRSVADLMSDNFVSVPATAEIHGQLIRFAGKTIQSSFEPVGFVQGFDHGHFNKLFSNLETEGTDERISVPLFQYEIVKVSAKTVLQFLTFSSIGHMSIGRRRCARMRKNDQISESADALVLWVEYDKIAVSRTQRYEMIWLNTEQRKQLDISLGMDVWCQWKDDEGRWKINIDNVSRGTSCFVSLKA